MSLKVLIVGGDNHELRIPMLRALRERGFDVAAAGSSSPAPFRDAGIEYYDYTLDRFVNSFADFTSIRGLHKAISSAQADVVQTFDTKPAILVPLAARRVTGCLVVRTINGLGWIYSSNSISALALRPVFETLCRLTAPLTAKTVFQNADDQAFFERKRLLGRGGSSLILGSGIDVADFRKYMPEESALEELRNSLGLQGCKIVVTVTRLNRIKGIPVLLAAAEMVNQTRPDVRFLIVGPRESEGALAVSSTEILQHSPYVQAVGPRSDIPAIMAIGDVFAFPTELREGIPRVLLEAAVAELPIITTRMPGCVDVVQDGETGWVVEPRNPEALASRIIECLDNPSMASNMARKSRQIVERKFSLRLTVDHYAKVYREVAGLAQAGIEGAEL